MTRKVAAFSLVLSFFGGTLYSQSPWILVTPQVVAKFPNSERGITALPSPQGFAGLTEPIFVQGTGDLSILDVNQKKILIVDNRFQIRNSIAYHYSEKVVLQDSRLVDYGHGILGTPEYDYDVSDASGVLLYHVARPQNDNDLPMDFLLYRNVLFLHFNRSGLSSYVLMGSPTSAQTMLDATQTRALFRDGAKVDFFGLTIDDKNRLFLSDELVTMDYPTFYDYFAYEKGNAAVSPPAHAIDSFDYSGLLKGMRSSGNMSFIGRDAVGNWYWMGAGFRVLVFDEVGWPIAAFERRDRTHAPTTVVANGDLYFLSHDDEWVYLSRIENVWDPLGRKNADTAVSSTPGSGRLVGVLNDSDIRVRAEPNSSATVLSKLKKDTKVIILDYTQDKQTINSQTSVWYKVRLFDGTEGWVFGSFLDIQK